MKAAENIVSTKLKLETVKANKKIFSSKLKQRLQVKLVRRSVLAGSLVLVMAILGIVIHSSGNNQLAAESVAMNAQGESPSSTINPLDQLSTADIAVQVARMTGIYEATSVANLADSDNAQTQVASNNSLVVSKPEVIATALKSRQDIVKYVVQPGDTLASLAVKFGVTSNSIIWSNSLANGNVTAGLSIYIPPINGIVYTVKAGDTAASLASTYNADASQITSFNDAEISGLQVGEQIVIPAGTEQSASLASSSYYSSSAYSFGYGPIYGYNGYDYGYCTWWAAQRRAQVGEPVPSNLGNAYSWYELAQAAGIPTGSTPQTHAVIWFGYDANHVGFVESVNPDGSIVISEMNRVGWAVEDTRTLSASEAASYKYIY
ncbi:MAG TPA: CHAP domain-containing protein [Candidatus Saccharimonadales bacterium]|nr:CHAP domain-containing protein [Candidatus Saccharimonadales bacterium]